MPNGNLTVILNGLEKVEITEYITTEPYFKARVTALRDSTPDVKSIGVRGSRGFDPRQWR